MPRRTTTQDPQSLSSGRAGRLPIVGGRPCLDFVNTTSGRGTTDRREHLRAYGDLLAWGHHAGILTAEEAFALSRTARAKAVAARRTLAQAAVLREALHAIFEATAYRRSIPVDAVALLNRFMVGAARAERLEPSGAPTWRWTSDPRHLARPLWSITRSAVELLTEGPLDRVKVCPGQACGWIFLDRTRNGRRRWCEMQVCGSRSKMRRYRQRHSG